jgi:hypothetical protein
MEDDTGEYETMGLLSTTDPDDAVCVGCTKTKFVDTVVIQGFDGAHAMDDILRECLQYERGSRLHLCVAYRLLRLQVMKEAIVATHRVFMPDLMILYVGPVGVPETNQESALHCAPPETNHPHYVQHSKNGVDSIAHAFMRVRVFRFIVAPTGLSPKTNKRKLGSEHTNSEDEACGVKKRV